MVPIPHREFGLIKAEWILFAFVKEIELVASTYATATATATSISSMAFIAGKS
jgi:hypothetical protein